MAESILSATTSAPEVSKDETPKYDNFYTPQNDEFYKTFKYHTLDRKNQEIRLIRLLPDSGTGAVVCELVDNLPLAQFHNKYTALSYYAGDPRKTETILVNNFRFNVFANLGHALREVRTFWMKTYPKHKPSTGKKLVRQGKGQKGRLPSYSKKLLLWVDQICINQSEMEERSHQVGFMRDIYQHAEQALVCLSTEEGTERVSGRLLHKLLKIIPSRLDDHSGMKLKAVRPLFQKIPSEEAQSFLKIFLSQWWRRAWVYQEFVVSSDAIFLCTGHSMHWHFLLNAAEAVDFKLIRREFQSLAGWCHEAGMREALVVALTLLHAKRRWTGQSDIKTLLAHARFMDASDTRDKIYAFLGLAEQDYSITPDYSVTNTASDLCLQITTNIILAENRLTVLELAAQCSLPGPGGPSWVLNMQPPLDGQYHSLLFHPSEHPKEAGPAVKFVPRNEETGPRLLVQGVRLSKTLVEAHYSETRCAVEPRRSFRTPLCEQDELWFLFGARPPYVLRPKGYHFIFIGEAWNTHCCDQDPLGAVYLDRYNAERQVLEAVKTSLLQWTEVSVI